jgi:SHS2 domain-containing protein
MGPKGFEEIPHAADRAMRVWAGDLPLLFTEAARGLNCLAGVKMIEGTNVMRHFESEGPDYESLLVAFLSELIFLAEVENLAFSKFDVGVLEESNDRCRISTVMEGAPIQSSDNVFKAVTYHNLEISRTDRGYEAKIVFDV